ncbi:MULTISPECIES: FG-GAP repeat domain-containing protein [unclassified Streptomyces]|uniref:FG-GAP repeat domain-containing protein n=1 Tax=unclassified Streptomyces TaxID=2593676 RepID=UPI0035DD5E49
MHVTRPYARRIAAAAVTVVLAATGGTLTALPAAAATAPEASRQDRQEAAVAFPRDADVVGAGPSGFLSKTRGTTPEFRWTRYSDGSSAVLAGASAAGGGSDLVVTGDRALLSVSSVLRIHDTAKPDATPVEIDLDALGGYHYSGLAGDTLLLGRYEGGYGVQYAAALDAAVLTGGTPKLRQLVGGVQVDCEDAEGGWTDTASALYDCRIGTWKGSAKILVDLASGKETWIPQGQDQWVWDGAVSATHMAWREARLGGDGIVAYRRGETRERWIPDPEGEVQDPLYLVGGWLAYGRKAHIDASAPAGTTAAATVRPFTVRSVETGEEAVLLTAFSSAVTGPDGSLLVRGGTPEHGEGLYRIAPRADGGRPTAEPVATTGQATVVALTGSTAPKALTGDRLANGADFGWDLSRGDAHVTVSLTHVGSGKSLVREWPAAAGGPRRISWHWDGKDVERPGGVLTPARAGTYEWRIVARPDEGIGPELTGTGRFTVTRPAASHDFDDDGTADLLARQSDGTLWSFRTRTAAAGGPVVSAGAVRIGPGWQVYDRIEAAGNLAGTTAPDVVARDRTGVLWLYRGTGDRVAPLTGRTRIGGGWQGYDRIAAGGDLTGDGRPDLLTTDKTGVLWLHPGTGSATAPFAARKRIGGGWDVYNEIASLGNLAGGPAGDLVARDRAGALWLYLGKGDGTFAARIPIGKGWGAFTDLVGIGDADGDGRADLIASATGATFYAGTGNWKAPFKPGVKTGVTNGVRYDIAF